LACSFCCVAAGQGQGTAWGQGKEKRESEEQRDNIRTEKLGEREVERLRLREIGLHAPAVLLPLREGDLGERKELAYKD
jgi:hypothetical protein